MTTTSDISLNSSQLPAEDNGLVQNGNNESKMTRSELIKRFIDPIQERHFGGITVELYFDTKSVKKGEFYMYVKDTRDGHQATNIDQVIKLPRDKVTSGWNHPIPTAFEHQFNDIVSVVAEPLTKGVSTAKPEVIDELLGS